MKWNVVHEEKNEKKTAAVVGSCWLSVVHTNSPSLQSSFFFLLSYSVDHYNTLGSGSTFFDTSKFIILSIYCVFLGFRSYCCFVLVFFFFFPSCCVASSGFLFDFFVADLFRSCFETPVYHTMTFSWTASPTLSHSFNGRKWRINMKSDKVVDGKRTVQRGRCRWREKLTSWQTIESAISAINSYRFLIAFCLYTYIFFLSHRF